MIDPIKIIGVTEICNQIADIYRKKMDAADYNKQGELYNFKWTTEWKDNLFEVYFELPSYFPFAEYGRRPGKMPPVNKILQWIEFKHLVPRSNNGRVPTTKQLAFAISKHIALHGTEGKHLFEKTLDDPNLDNLADNLVELITAEFEKEIEQYIETLWNI